MRSTFLLITIFGLLSFKAMAVQDRCNAIVFEGGGDLGAYEAGVLRGLVTNLKPQESRYDVVAGVSVGAITSALLSQYEVGDEGTAADWLVNFWHTVTKDDVYSNWVPGGILEGLTDKPGLFNTEPLKKIIAKYITQKPKRLVSILACDANEGLYHRYDETLRLDEFQEGVVASASVPMLFPWQNLKGAQLFDGGVCKMTDISGAILKCRTLVNNDDTKIHITVVYISNKGLEPWTGKETSLEALNRYFKINNFRKCYRELAAAWDFYHNVNYDYIIAPSTPLPGAKFPFTFGADRLLEMINQGISDAAIEVALGPGNSIHNFLEMAQRQEAQDHDIDFTEANIKKMIQGKQKRAQKLLEKQNLTVETL